MKIRSHYLSLLCFLVVLFLFTRLHWTQRYEHVMVFLEGGCQSEIVSTKKPFPNMCSYENVVLDTDLLTSEYLLSDYSGHVIRYPGEAFKGLARDHDSSPFTGRTYALMALMLCALGGALYWGGVRPGGWSSTVRR